MDNLDTEKQALTQGAEAQSEDTAVNCGKFKSVEALLSAYESLEAEFTRRSQRLKELENASNAAYSPATAVNDTPTSQNAQSAPLKYEGEEFVAAALASDSVKDAVIGEYLKSVTERRGVPLMVGGSAVTAKRDKIGSVKEAGKLVSEFLVNRPLN